MLIHVLVSYSIYVLIIVYIYTYSKKVMEFNHKAIENSIHKDQHITYLSQIKHIPYNILKIIKMIIKITK